MNIEKTDRGFVLTKEPNEGWSHRTERRPVFHNGEYVYTRTTLTVVSHGVEDRQVADIQVGVRTVNEVRAEEGLPPLDRLIDTLFTGALTQAWDNTLAATARTTDLGDADEQQDEAEVPQDRLVADYRPTDDLLAAECPCCKKKHLGMCAQEEA